LAVKVRLTRVGSKKNPIWRVVVADGRSPRDGRSIETIGHYNPQTQPSRIEIDRERLQHWLDRGAQPSNTVKKLIRAENTGFDMPASAAPAPVPAAAAPAEPPAEESQADATPETPEADAATEAPDVEAPAPDAPAEEAPAAENEASEGGPGEEPSADVPEDEVVADESEAPADADENP
jgi:small subunit ribosomal protein S16